MLKRNLFFAFILLFTLPVMAATPAASADMKHIKKVLKDLLGDIQPDNIVDSELPGFYQVTYDTDIIYISKDGRFVINGDVLDSAKQVNLTENKRSAIRKSLIDKIPDSQTIVFAPENYKYTVTVFTDIDCGYCRKLHSEIKSYLDRGIRIRYMFFPRSGKNTRSYKKAVTVWCSKDRKAALTQAKKGANLSPLQCGNPIDQHMQVATKVGVRGTPMIVLENGRKLPGYVNAEQLKLVIEAQAAR